MTGRAVRGLLAGMFLLAVTLSASAVSASGLGAEGEGRWEEALAEYRSDLEKDPDQPDLWLRISDIEAYLGRPEQAAEAIASAANLRPTDAALQYRLSQAWSAAGRPEKAREAIQWAMALSPGEVEYLIPGAQIAAWTGAYDSAIESYLKVLEIDPTDDATLLALAKVESWAGELDEAVGHFKEYKKRRPDDGSALLDFAGAQTWRGNYFNALALLQEYKGRFGETEQFRDRWALVLALSGRSSDALDAALPALHDNPDNYTLRYAETIAHAKGRDPEAALEGLAKLDELEPENPLTRGARLYVETPIRSSVTPSFIYMEDSDSIENNHFGLEARFFFEPKLSLKLRLETDSLRADPGSGLEPLDGEGSIRHFDGRIGLDWRISPKSRLEGSVGGARAGDHSMMTYDLAYEWTPRDGVTLRLERDYGYYPISPRSLDLGIRRAENRVRFSAGLGLPYTLDAWAQYDTFSDGNSRWELVLGPRRSVLRTEHFNLDVGIQGWWFGFDKDLDSGYYDPGSYQRYSLTLMGYVKLNDDAGISIIVSPGALKDDSMKNFRFGVDAGVEATFGIFGDWMLVLRYGYYQNSRFGTGAYRTNLYGIYLTRRF